MARAICRCGEKLPAPPAGTDRVICPKCNARVRIRPTRKEENAQAVDDGFIRFFCPCGRRLKVTSQNPPSHGKCPDCGKVVPVPKSSVDVPPGPESPTEDLTPADIAALDAWAAGIKSGQINGIPPTTTAVIATMPGRVEAGLRVCPRCGKPIHMGADVCRGCGTVVPKR